MGPKARITFFQDLYGEDSDEGQAFEITVADVRFLTFFLYAK